MNPEPHFYAKQLGIDSFHCKYASCLQTTNATAESAYRMSTRVWDMFSPPTKRRLTIALLATHISINKSTILGINPIINYQNPKFPTRGVSANEENKASLAVSRRMVHLYLPDALGIWHHNHNTVSQYTHYIYYICYVSVLWVSKGIGLQITHQQQSLCVLLSK